MNSLDDLEVLKRCGYRVLFQGHDLGPLAQAPKIRFLHDENSYLVYDADGRESSLALSRGKSAEIILCLKDAVKALGFVSAAASERSGALCLRPEAPGKGFSLHFANGAFLPEAEFIPEAGKEQSVKVTYRAVAEPSSGKLFSFA